MPDDDDLDARLRRVVVRIRLPVADDCARLFDRLIAVAVERVAETDARRADDAATAMRPDDAVHATRRDEAVDAFRRIVDDVTQQARILRLDALPAPAVVQALARLCPLWPFC